MPDCQLLSTCISIMLTVLEAMSLPQQLMQRQLPLQVPRMEQTGLRLSSCWVSLYQLTI
jgi:hypothetical protein